MSYYVDVHAHLTHERFTPDVKQVIKNAEEKQLKYIICNGLDPESNRTTLQLAQENTIVKASLGIYPIHAVNDRLPHDFPLKIPRFDVWQEIAFIEEEAKKGTLVAIGECGLDGYWLDQSTYSQQEKVWQALISLAQNYNLPLIIHTRKLEKRAIEILAHGGVKNVNFHCFGGKTKLAIKSAEKYDWYFSIPANSRKNEAFTKLLGSLPEHLILTETDCPYLSYEKNTRNEPANVVHTVGHLAEIKGWSMEEARTCITQNFERLFPGALK